MPGLCGAAGSTMDARKEYGPRNAGPLSMDHCISFCQ